MPTFLADPFGRQSLCCNDKGKFTVIEMVAQVCLRRPASLLSNLKGLASEKLGVNGFRAFHVAAIRYTVLLQGISKDVPLGAAQSASACPFVVLSRGSLKNFISQRGVTLSKAKPDIPDLDLELSAEKPSICCSKNGVNERQRFRPILCVIDYRQGRPAAGH